MKDCKKNKDILFLLQYFYPEYISSATLPYDTAEALANAGYSVDVICGYPKEYCNEKVNRKELHKGINIQRLSYVQLSRKSVLGRLINYFSFTLSVLIRLFSMKKYKAIIVYSNPPLLPWVAAIAAKLFSIKLIFVAYDLYPEIAIKTGVMSENGCIAKVMRYINNIVYKNADIVIALSTEMKEFISRNRPIPGEKVTVIPNWFEDKYNNRSNSKNKFAAVVKDRMVVSYFGNMGIAQDMKTIVESVILLKNEKDICFLFAGHGNKYNFVKEQLYENRVENAYMYDFLHGDDYIDALQISDCAILSLEKNLTGLCVPSKTYGYMMQGIALAGIIGESDISRDISNGAGVCVSNGDSEELSNKIRLLNADRALLENMKRKSREIFLEKYTAEKAKEKYLTVVRSLLVNN